MTGVSAPAGWETLRPAMPGSIGRWHWQHPDAGWVHIDLYGPRLQTATPANVGEPRHGPRIDPGRPSGWRQLADAARVTARLAGQAIASERPARRLGKGQRRG